jgi:hypothetical protein
VTNLASEVKRMRLDKNRFLIRSYNISPRCFVYSCE